MKQKHLPLEFNIDTFSTLIINRTIYRLSNDIVYEAEFKRIKPSKCPKALKCIFPNGKYYRTNDRRYYKVVDGEKEWLFSAC